MEQEKKKLRTIADVLAYRWEKVSDEKLEQYYNRCAVLCNMMRNINYWLPEEDKRLDIELELETTLSYIDFKMQNEK